MRRGTERRGGREGARLVGLCLVAALLAAPVASASGFGPAASSRIGAGGVESVVLEAAVPGVEERELVLSLDGGKTFPVRLTREIEPGDRMATWRVPVLLTEHAVLALREGGDGFEEEIVATSAEFVIHPTPGSPVEELRFRDGEWKTREADAGRVNLPSQNLGSAGQERVGPLDDAFVAFEEPVRALPGCPDLAAVPYEAAAPSPSSSGTCAFPPVTRFLPLRE